MEGYTRSGPLGTGPEGRKAGQDYAYTCNEEEAAAGGGGGDGAGPSDGGAGMRTAACGHHPRASISALLALLSNESPPGLKGH